MSTAKEPILIPEDFKIWYLAESRKEPTTEAYKEWQRRGQQLCFEVAYTQGYQDASEAAYRHLSSQPSPGLRWIEMPEVPLEGGLYICEINTKSNGCRATWVDQLEFMKGHTGFLGLLEGHYVTKWLCEETPSAQPPVAENNFFCQDQGPPECTKQCWACEETEKMGKVIPPFGKAPEAQPIADHMHVKLEEAKNLIEGFVRIWRAEGNKGGAPQNIRTAIKFLAQFPQSPQAEK